MHFKLPFPHEIAGVKIPTLGESGSKLAKLTARSAAAGMDVVAEGEQVYGVLGSGCERVKGSCGALVAAADSIASIQVEMKPVMPLFRARENPVLAFESLSRESLAACVRVTEDVLSLGGLLHAIGTVLKDVRAGFQELSTDGQPLVDKFKEFAEDVAAQFGAALDLTEGLQGIEDFFEQLESLVNELADIKGVLGPVLDDFDEGEWSSLAAFGLDRWEKVVEAMERFMPAWTKSQELYNRGQGFCTTSLHQARTAWGTFRSLITRFCGEVHVDVPAWLGEGEDTLVGVEDPRPVTVQHAPTKRAGWVDPALLPALEAPPRGLGKLCCSVMRVCGGGARTTLQAARDD